MSRKAPLFLDCQRPVSSIKFVHRRSDMFTMIPLLGKYHCHNISQDTLRNYSKERREIFGRNPAASTVATHNTAINYILNKAKGLGDVEFVPKTINDGEDKGKWRSYFTDTELRKLNNFFMGLEGQKSQLRGDCSLINLADLMS